MLILFTAVSCNRSPENSRNEVVGILKGLEAPYDSKARLQAESQLRGMGTNAIPSLLLEMESIGMMLETKEPTQVGKAMWRRSALQDALKTLGTNMQPFAEDFIKDLNTGRNPADAAYALVQMDNQYASNIIEALTNQSSSVRLAAAGTISYIASNSSVRTNSVPLLIMLLTDESPPVRMVSARTLGSLGFVTAKCLPALLLRAERDPDPMVRIAAVGAISLFGTNAVPMKNELQRAAESESNPAVKRAFEIAIDAIR